MVRAVAAASVLAGALGCAADLRHTPLDIDETWPEAPQSRVAGEEIAYASRLDGASYGLPRDGMASIADLIALFPTQPVGVSDPDIFVAPDLSFPTDQCRGGAPEVVRELPMTIEGVVTLHPRQYMKVTICGQDERHYGVFTIEDDTGGIVVLRDSRVAPYSFGDRVRLRVKAITLTFGRELDTRAILVSDIEKLPVASGAIAYRETSEPFSSADVGDTVQVEGYVHIEPVSRNFGSMLVTSAPFTRGRPAVSGDMLQCVRTCEVRCLDGCPSNEACGDICPDLCVRNGARFVQDELPSCWIVGIDAELQRRGFSPPYGAPVRARGPVVNNFDVQMWVNSPGQIELR